MSVRFRPVKGKEDSIKSLTYTEGYAYFATDTGNLYLDADGKRIQMGGTGSSIYYASAKELEENAEGYYVLSKDTLDDQDVIDIVKADDLIINNDGSFYRVEFIDNDGLWCNRIAVSGTGGSSDSSSVSKKISISLQAPQTTNLINGQSASINFTATSAIDTDGSVMDETLQVSWQLSEKIGTSTYTVYRQGTIDVTSGVTSTFEFGSRLRESTTSRLTMQAIGINSEPSSLKNIEFTTTKMELTQSANFSNKKLYDANSVILECNAVGNLEKILDFYFDGVLLESRLLTASSIDTQSLTVDKTLTTHGNHTIKIELYQSINGTRGLSVDPIEFEIAVRTADGQEPIIWFGTYKSEYYNYDSIQIPYLVYNPTSTISTQVYLYKNDIQLGDARTVSTSNFDTYNIFEITDADLNEVNYYQISCGETKREISFTVVQDPNRDMEIVKQDWLKYNFTAAGRSNSESTTNRSIWEQNGIKAKFTNFNWYNNGWVIDDDGNTCLRISNGASFTIPIGSTTFASSNNTQQSHTYEFQFKIRNAQDYSSLIHNVTRYKLGNGATDNEYYEQFKNQTVYDNYDSFLHDVLGSDAYDELEYNYVDKQINLRDITGGYYQASGDTVIGWGLGPQDAFFSNGTNTVNVSYVEDKLINLAIVYAHDSNKLISIYLNGVLAGVIYSTATSSFSINPAEGGIVFNSNYCDIDLYKMRIYNTALSVNDIVTNYSVDLKDVTMYDQNKLAKENTVLNEYQFNYQNMLDYNTNNPSDPIMPYLVLDTSISNNNDRLPWSKSTKIKVNMTFVNTGLDAAYESGRLNSLATNAGVSVEDYYIHHCPSFTCENVKLAVQGTSSQFYPRRNYKAKIENTVMYANKGPFLSENQALDYFYMDNNTVGTTKFTLKVDYMESSGSYNCGLANLVYNAYSNHPLKDYHKAKAFEVESSGDYSDYRTSVQGFPVLAFHKDSSGNYTYIGKYNMLIDKGSDECYGFKPNESILQNFVGDGSTPVCNIVECWEYSNNSRGYCSFRDPLGRKELSFNSGSGTTIETDNLQNSFEYRYNSEDNILDILYKLNETTGPTTEEEKTVSDIYKDVFIVQNPQSGHQLMLDKYSNWEKAVKWVWSTCIENIPQQNDYQEIYLGKVVYQSGKYYIHNEDNTDYVLCTEDEYDEEKTYYTRALTTSGTWEYSNAYVGPIAYETDKYYIKDDDGNYVKSSDAFADTEIYYEGISKSDATLAKEADLLVTLCDELNYDSSKTYYNYDGTVKVALGELAVTQANVTEDNYAPGKYYIAKPVTYGSITYKYDTQEYRSDKFTRELTKHFNLDYLATYFVVTEVLMLYDSRGKNCMMASWGPQEAGGDYIWYPIFYDMDTQLGINNTGIPSFEYYVDATEDGTFSTNDSVLWNNFYRLFKSNITAKYRQLRGKTESIGDFSALSNAPFQSVDKVEKWYQRDPDECNSIVMEGERPLIATNLDEYYKYITITNSRTGGGYLDSGGSIAKDNGTYFYALQGDRSLSRQQFLTNRFNYIDSWLNQGDYERAGGSNYIRGRVSANRPANISDKWVTGVTNGVAGLETSEYFEEDGKTKKHEFDAEYWVDLTPVRNSYVTLGDDNESYPSQKYTGTTVRFEINKIKNGVLSSPNYAEQLLYIYGLGQIGSLGDMSKLYWQEFDINFSGTNLKLKDLKLGYDGLDEEGNSYYNKKVNDYGFKAGKNDAGLPLLQEVNLCNVEFTNAPSLDFSSCEKLTNFRATGCNAQEVQFAEGVALDTLYLSETITKLSLTEADKLTNIITEYKYPEKINDELVAEKGLYLPGLTDKEPETAQTKIAYLELIGGSLGYDSYTLLTNYYNARVRSSAVSQISMTDVNWCPYVQLVEGDTYNADNADKYYIDSGHYTFNAYTYDSSNWDLQVLNGEIYKYDDTISEEKINQITNIDMLKDMVSNKLFNNTVSSDNTIPNITGIVYVKNADGEEVEESYIRNTLGKQYPGLVFFFDKVTKAYSGKFILVEDDGSYSYVPFKDTTISESEKSIQKISQSEVAAGTNWFENPYTLYVPEKVHYDFLGWSTDNTSNNIITQDEWDNKTFEENNFDYTFYAIFTIHSYNIKFYNYDDSLIDTLQIPYGSYLEEPSTVPSKDSSSLELTKRYGFQGYTNTKGSSSLVNLSTIRSLKDQSFYAVYEEESVYDSPFDNKYFDFNLKNPPSGTDRTEKGYYISLKSGVALSGKITLPSTYKGVPVIGVNYGGFQNNKTITHVFWYPQDAENLLIVDTESFDSASNLVYFEFSKSIRIIGNKAFNGCKLINNTIGNNIYAIRDNAFNRGMDLSASNYTLYIGANVQDIGNSFNYIGVSNIIIGNTGEPSQLSIVSSSGIIIQNNSSTPYVSNITIYTETGATGKWSFNDFVISPKATNTIFSEKGAYE